ncbi:fumarylacetoacetate hydrolase family protein [Achromobacter arsenitoxydans]|uniref:Fumarylacetoacetate (FAA) hydrolase n=1 Tax=Achromobacter arsenitoxydans SY8 TaxID=477184 RepID=H0F4T9_9BURK|nr:fumarylacetoacetate hydrolase family protein [Achromobacter arsenitoxydans]EHK66740.1 fumarylacetoacetate (FAA) hydrolase [Achromobacter arsenitoxydans SY8]
MTDFAFPAPAPVTLPIANSASRFPVARVFCIGRNYRWQPGEPAPRAMPAWFMKPASAITPAGGDLPYPPGTADFCHEIELVVAIGRGGRDIAPEHAEDRHIWGYAAGLDLTRRDLQHEAKRAGGPWEPAKAFDRSAPCTPIVPVADCGHLRQGALWLTVNGMERQRADISDLLWPVPELLAMLSRSVALMPGDLIYTGTPAGVGPLTPGDTVSAGVADIGRFTLTVTGATHSHPASFIH